MRCPASTEPRPERPGHPRSPESSHPATLKPTSVTRPRPALATKGCRQTLLIRRPLRRVRSAPQPGRYRPPPPNGTPAICAEARSWGRCRPLLRGRLGPRPRPRRRCLQWAQGRRPAATTACSLSPDPATSSCSTQLRLSSCPRLYPYQQTLRLASMRWLRRFRRRPQVRRPAPHSANSRVRPAAHLRTGFGRCRGRRADRATLDSRRRQSSPESLAADFFS